MIGTYLCQQEDGPACRFLEQLADGDVGPEADGPYRRMFTEIAEMPAASVRIGWISLKHGKDMPRLGLKLAVVRPGVDPMEAVLRMGVTAEHVLLVASVSRHLDWIRAGNRRLNKEFISVAGDVTRPVGCFANAMLLNDREPRPYRRFYENPVRHSVSIYLKGGLYTRINSSSQTTIEDDRHLDSATD